MGIAVRGRTVAEMVKDIGGTSPDTRFYIGAKSGFLFIGTKAEYDAGINALSEKIHDYYVESRKAAQMRLKAAECDVLHIEKGELLEKYAERVLRFGDQIKADLHRVDQCSKILDVWKSVPERKVKEAYKKDELLDPSGIVLLVDGPEAGVWFKEEFENGVKED